MWSDQIFFLFCSLSRFNVVPQKVLDTELKKTFAHFNDGRIPVSKTRPDECADFRVMCCLHQHGISVICFTICSAGVGGILAAVTYSAWPAFRTTSITRRTISGLSACNTRTRTHTSWPRCGNILSGWGDVFMPAELIIRHHLPA